MESYDVHLNFVKETELPGTSVVYLIRTLITTTNIIHYGTETFLKDNKQI